MSGKVKVTAFGETRVLPKDDDTLGKLDKMRADGVQFTVADADEPEAVDNAAEERAEQPTPPRDPNGYRDPSSESMLGNAVRDIRSFYSPPGAREDIERYKRADNEMNGGVSPIERMSQAVVGTNMPTPFAGSGRLAAGFNAGLGTAAMQAGTEAQDAINGRSDGLAAAAQRIARAGAGGIVAGQALQSGANAVVGAVNPLIERAAQGLRSAAAARTGKLVAPNADDAVEVGNSLYNQGITPGITGRTPRSYANAVDDKLAATNESLGDIAHELDTPGKISPAAAPEAWQDIVRALEEQARQTRLNGLSDKEAAVARNMDKNVARSRSPQMASPAGFEDINARIKQWEDLAAASPNSAQGQAAAKLAREAKSQMNDSMFNHDMDLGLEHTLKSADLDDLTQLQDNMTHISRDPAKFDWQTAAKVGGPGSIAGGIISPSITGLASGAATGLAAGALPMVKSSLNRDLGAGLQLGMSDLAKNVARGLTGTAQAAPQATIAAFTVSDRVRDLIGRNPAALGPYAAQLQYLQHDPEAFDNAVDKLDRDDPNFRQQLANNKDNPQ